MLINPEKVNRGRGTAPTSLPPADAFGPDYSAVHYNFIIIENSVITIYYNIRSRQCGVFRQPIVHVILINGQLHPPTFSLEIENISALKFVSSCLYHSCKL